MLEYFKSCLNEKKEVSVVYLGGSITEGAGASVKEKRWQSLFDQWLNEQYPEVDIKGYNAGIGGTNSELGVFRMEQDVLSHKPDLMFVEFAVNDYARDNDDIIASMEGIVRKARKVNPKTDIVFLYTTMMKMAKEAYELGVLPESVIAQQKVADYYGIPTCNCGRHLLAVMKDSCKQPEELLPDLVHPNDRGYQIYFEYIKSYFTDLLADKNPSDYVEKSPLSGESYEQSRMIDAVLQEAGDFRKEYITFCGRYPSYVSSNEAGSMLSFTFTGDSFGIYMMIAKDSGILEYQVDASGWEKLDTWDHYALRFDRANHKMLARHLAFGTHTITLRVSGEKNAESKGAFIRIAAFLTK